MLDHADRTAFTRQHELDHKDHTDHTAQEYICPERSRSRTVVGTYHTVHTDHTCLLYTSPSPRDLSTSRMPSSA